MSEMTNEQANAALDVAVNTINSKMGESLLGKFYAMRGCPDTLCSMIKLAGSVHIEKREMGHCIKYILERAIIANQRMISLMNETNQKLEELKKELKHG